MLNDSKAVNFWKQFLGLLQALLLDLEHLMFIARLTENTELPAAAPCRCKEGFCRGRGNALRPVNRIEPPLNRSRRQRRRS